MSQFQRFAQGFKSLFASKKTESSQDEPAPAGVPPKETNPTQEEPPPAGIPPTEKSEPAPVGSAESALKETSPSQEERVCPTHPTLR